MLQYQAQSFQAVRQAIALSLVTLKECTIAVAPQVFTHPHYGRMVHSLINVLQQLSVTIAIADTTITLKPHKMQSFTATIALHPYCPIADIFLCMAPALIKNEVQSDILFHGVTHSQFSRSTGFIRYGLAPLLQQFGCYLYSATKKFGFYSATGTAATKVYPAIHKHSGAIVTINRITGVKIYIANINQEFALYQKQKLAQKLSLSDDTIHIVQIVNVTNHGNAVDVFFISDTIPGMLSFTLPLYNENGAFIFEDSMMDRFIEQVAKECQKNYDYFPLPIIEEALPFIVSAGHDYTIVEKVNPAVATTESYELCQLFAP
ncbi:MAG: hypothetical protein KBG92_08120 [Spirochaetes bacterium]|nr:hypothetical protein [Spirochaetota bacterium]